MDIVRSRGHSRGRPPAASNPPELDQLHLHFVECSDVLAMEDVGYLTTLRLAAWGVG